jgi:hypothetical protein
MLLRVTYYGTRKEREHVIGRTGMMVFNTFVRGIPI